MKKYLQDKLFNVVDAIEATKRSILQQVADGQFTHLKSHSDNIVRLQDRQDEFIRDIVVNLTVDEVIEINDRKNFMNEVLPSPFNLNRLYYHYKYSAKVSINDRDKLVNKFGYKFKDIPVK